jgi:hypothetical protein
MFHKDGSFEHSNPNTTLYIRVLSVIHLNEERIKLKVNYHHKTNDRMQYTGIGATGYSDTIVIKRKDFANWTKKI